MWDWKKWEVADGLKCTFTKATVSEDAEILDIEVTAEATQQVLLHQRMYDTTDLSSAETALRAIALSKNGKQLAVISENFADVETASIRSGNSVKGIRLCGFRGGTLELEFAHTIDERGAAFSFSGNILAICEDSNVVGFWRTSDGECMGRVIFHPAARGCIVDEATGLPPEFVMANSDGKDGWIVEVPGTT